MKNRIREELDLRGMTQKELAQGIGMSEIGLSKALDGSATKATINKIANYLGVESSNLIVHTNMPKALYEGELHIGDKTLSCAVLDNGMRVLSAKTVFSAFDRPRKGRSSENYRVDQMPSFINANNLQPFVDEQLIEWTKVVEYIDARNIKRQGYNARILRGLCKVYMDARRADALLQSQARFALIAESILLALSDVGIVALIDEATGYDKVKNQQKDNLQKWLNTFLAEEASRWVKMFPDSFFEMVYKMYGWTWTNSPQKPGVVGNIINDWVYLRLGPKVLEELNRLNPKNAKGSRSHKHHQNLSETIGKPALQRHLEALKALGAASGYNKARFIDMLNRAYPRPNEQFTFDFGDWE